LIRYANNHELLAMASPKPVAIIAASQDQSSQSQVRRVFEYETNCISRLAHRKIGFFEDTTGQGISRRSAEQLTVGSGSG
jgi:hypothetical protein